jgi:hypothetical protein
MTVRPSRYNLAEQARHRQKIAPQQRGGALVAIPLAISGLRDSVAAAGPLLLPDPDQRYVLQIDPALFASVDFSMGFDDNGSLTDTSAKLTDQTGTILTAVGKLGLSLAALDVAKDPPSQPEIAKAIDQAISAALASGAIKDPDTGAPRPVTQGDLSAWKTLQPRLHEAGRLGELLTKFVFRDYAEYTLVYNGLEVERERYARRPPGDVYTAFLDKASEAHRAIVEPARRNIDIDGLKDFKAGLLKERAGQRQKLEAQLDRSNPGDTSALKTALDVNRSSIALANAALENIPEHAPAAAALRQIVSIKPKEWQARMVAAINKQIEARRQIARIKGAPEPEQSDKALRDLLRQKAAILGVLPEFNRAEALRSVTTAEKDIGRFRRVADEIAYLDRRMSQVEAALKPEQQAQKGEEGTPARWVRLTNGDLAASDCIKEELKERRPAYVVVLEPVASATPPKKPGAATKPTDPAGGGGASGIGSEPFEIPKGPAPALPEVPPVKNG